MKSTQVLRQFRMVAILEGLSYVALLFFAMPLKYMADMPMAVRITGMAHGILFIAYVAWLVVCHMNFNWDTKFSIKAFIASLLPFGTFVLDRKLKVMEDEMAKT